MIVAVIVVVAVVASKSSDDSGDSPAPSPVNPGTPLDFKEYNPFKLDMNSTEEQDWYFTGYINNTHKSKNGTKVTGRMLSTQDFLKENDQKYYKLQKSDGEGMAYKPVDPEMIKTGMNNEETK